MLTLAKGTNLALMFLLHPQRGPPHRLEAGLIMGKHIVVGSGQVGAHLATKLLAQGHDVTVVTRSGRGPDGAVKVAADVADQARLTEISKGADVLYNCVNPRYHRWLTDWPPMAASFLAAAEATGAVLTIVGNLYPYGPVTGPMTEDLPLASTDPKARVRAKMWTLPWPLVRAMGLVSPMVGELKHVRYQFVAPYELDSSAFQRTFGVAPTPMDEALKATLGA